MPLTDKDYAEFKKICDKEGITYKTEAEYHESANNLVNFVDILIKIDQEEKARERHLEKEPKGFAFESRGRTCSLCGHHVDGEMWYDKWGMKCMDCQQALNKKLVPGYVFKDHKNEKHITASQLSWRFKIHIQTIKKLVRQGKLKARVLPHGPMVFLRRENRDLKAIIETEIKQKSS